MGDQERAAEDIIRAEAVYFLKGNWRDVIESHIPTSVFQGGGTFIFAIIPALEPRGARE